MLELGYYVFRPLAAQGPADLICVNDTGQIILLDSKSDSKRINPGRSKPERIYRKLSDTQKLLNVRMAYVNKDERTVFIKPPIE